MLSGRVDVSFPQTQPLVPKNVPNKGKNDPQAEAREIPMPNPTQAQATVSPAKRRHPKKKKFRTMLESSSCDLRLRAAEGSSLLETLANITAQQTPAVSTATVGEEGTHVIKITRNALETLFEMYQGE